MFQDSMSFKTFGPPSSDRFSNFSTSDLLKSIHSPPSLPNSNSAKTTGSTVESPQAFSPPLSHNSQIEVNYPSNKPIPNSGLNISFPQMATVSTNHLLSQKVNSPPQQPTNFSSPKENHILNVSNYPNGNNSFHQTPLLASQQPLNASTSPNNSQIPVHQSIASMTPLLASQQPLNPSVPQHHNPLIPANNHINSFNNTNTDTSDDFFASILPMATQQPLNLLTPGVNNYVSSSGIGNTYLPLAQSLPMPSYQPLNPSTSVANNISSSGLGNNYPQMPHTSLLQTQPLNQSIEMTNNRVSSSNLANNYPNLAQSSTMSTHQPLNSSTGMPNNTMTNSTFANTLAPLGQISQSQTFQNFNQSTPSTAEPLTRITLTGSQIFPGSTHQTVSPSTLPSQTFGGNSSFGVHFDPLAATPAESFPPEAIYLPQPTAPPATRVIYKSDNSPRVSIGPGSELMPPIPSPSNQSNDSFHSVLPASPTPPILHMPSTHSAFSIPLVPNVPQISQIPQLPQIPQIPQIAQIPQIPQMPQTSQTVQIPLFSSAGNAQFTPQVFPTPQNLTMVFPLQGVSQSVPGIELSNSSDPSVDELAAISSRLGSKARELERVEFEARNRSQQNLVDFFGQELRAQSRDFERLQSNLIALTQKRPPSPSPDPALEALKMLYDKIEKLEAKLEVPLQQPHVVVIQPQSQTPPSNAFTPSVSIPQPPPPIHEPLNSSMQTPTYSPVPQIQTHAPTLRNVPPLTSSSLPSIPLTSRSLTSIPSIYNTRYLPPSSIPFETTDFITQPSPLRPRYSYSPSEAIRVTFTRGEPTTTPSRTIVHRPVIPPGIEGTFRASGVQRNYEAEYGL